MQSGSREVNVGMVGDGMGQLERAVIFERWDVWVDRFGPVDLRLGVSGEGVNLFRARVTDPSRVVITFEIEIPYEGRFQVLARLKRERGMVAGYIYDFEEEEVLDVVRERNNGNMGRCAELVGCMMATIMDKKKLTLGRN